MSLPSSSFSQHRSAAAATATRQRQRRRPSSSSPPPSPTPLPTCVHVGPKISLGNTTITASADSLTHTLYKTECVDFTLITDADFTPTITCGGSINSSGDSPALPSNGLKAAQINNWRYVLHISHGLRVAVTRDHLRARVSGGQILAYQYSDSSIEGNASVYYGFLPTSKLWANTNSRRRAPDTLAAAVAAADSGDNDSGVHTTRYVASRQIWPRRLIVYLQRESGCDCAGYCSRWRVRLRDTTVQSRICGKHIPWSQVYIMMGDIETDSGDTMAEQILRVPRLCLACAQCPNCLTSATYCRKHTVCRHVSISVFGENGLVESVNAKDCIARLNSQLTLARMKKCQRIRNK